MNHIEDAFLLDINTYEDYLDLFITRKDIGFLRNMRPSRMLVELGYRSTTEIYTPEQFKIRKAAAYEAMNPIKKSLILFHEGIIITDPVLYEFAEREKPNYQKTLSTIIFLCQRFKSGFEISGYIDFESSLKKSNRKTDDSTDWKAVYMKQTLLRPKRTDLSFYNSRTNTSFHNDSDNYYTINDYKHGLVFMHKGSLKKIYTNKPNELDNVYSKRKMVYSARYGHVVFYDHIIRKKI